MKPFVLQISHISLRLSDSGVKTLFEHFGQVTSVRFAKDQAGELLKVNRVPPSQYTLVYQDIEGNNFALTKGYANDPITHEFGTAIVTMPDEEGAFTAMSILTEVYIDGSVVEVERLGGDGTDSRCTIA